ncbi:MAG TPA: class I SAM-dependent methyltransferase [Methanoregula sp.]|nr:class I SAM-dependent methyltransferase [Methanoregula sp.]
MNPSRHVFEDLAGDYDRWFDENVAVYGAQVRLLRGAVPLSGCGLEVGVGSGRFAGPLGIRHGIDPSRNLLEIARIRGTDVVLGEGEHLPYRAGSVDYILMMTVICFAGDVDALFREAGRVLMPGGVLVIGFIERGGEIENHYRNEKTKGRFLRYARYWSADEITRLLEDAGFAAVAVSRRSGGFCVMTGTKDRG